MSYKSDNEYVAFIDQFPDKSFDVTVVDGSSRNECTYHAIKKLKPGGILIFDNSDGTEYREANEFLIKNDFMRIDFWGLIPSYPYKNCTSIYSTSTDFLKPKNVPCDHQSSIGISCFQAMNENK